MANLAPVSFWALCLGTMPKVVGSQRIKRARSARADSSLPTLYEGYAVVRGCFDFCVSVRSQIGFNVAFVLLNEQATFRDFQ